MQLVAPDILAEVVTLSLVAQLIALAVGVAVWLTGEMHQRFWVGLGVTAGFGLYGLQAGSVGGNPLIAGLFIALAAGYLAVELSRLFAFVSGGLTVVLVIHTFVPAFRELVLAYVAGGLLAVHLYRQWFLVLTSFVGSIIGLHALLGLAARFLKLNVVALAQQRPTWFDLGVVLLTVGGVIGQPRFRQYIASMPARKKAKVLKQLSDAERKAVESLKPPPPPPPKPRLWGLLKPK